MTLELVGALLMLSIFQYKKTFSILKKSSEPKYAQNKVVLIFSDSSYDVTVCSYLWAIQR